MNLVFFPAKPFFRSNLPISLVFWRVLLYNVFDISKTGLTKEKEEIMERFRFLIALWVGKILVFVTNLVAKGRGTNIPGAYANKIQKDFIRHFQNINYDNMFFITGTNGKSTTNNVIVHLLKTSGKKVCTNLEGANLIGGIATALIKNATWSGKVIPDIFCFEVDERSLPKIYPLLPARNLCVTNLQKDQVQRNGEPDFIYQKIRSVVTKEMTLYLNNEEPRVKSLEDLAGQVIYYGVEKNPASFTKDGFYDVTLPCPKCHHKIQFQYYNVDNIGHFSCTHCGFHSEETPTVLLQEVDIANGTFTCQGYSYTVPYRQPFFFYNYALGIAIAEHFSITPTQMQEAFTTFKNIGGRMEKLYYKTKEIKYIRMKQENPETLQSAFDYIARDDQPKVFLLGLEQLEDFKPYYTNTFYAFDCDCEKLLASHVEHCICFSEAIAYDSANRLIYAGFQPKDISILPTDDNKAILAELDQYDCDNVYLITWLHKYEQLQKDLKEYQKEGTIKDGE